MPTQASDLTALSRDVLTAIPLAESAPHVGETRPTTARVRNTVAEWRAQGASTGGVHEALERMADMGLVEFDPIDDKSKAVVLTPAGWDTLQTFNTRTEQALSERGVRAVEVE